MPAVPRPTLLVLLALAALSGSVVARGLGADPARQHRVVVGGVSRDGPLPTATPRPAPPVPGALAPCYAPRPADTEFVLRPAGPASVLQSCQVIAYYGYPGVPGLGVLAQAEPAAMVHRLREQAAAYDASNGARGVVIAFHLIAAVAQASPGPDGRYLANMPAEIVREWLALAEEHNALVILDLQIGASSVEAELPKVLPYLQNPRVHIALDPEWTMPPGIAPGTIIGWMTAAQINHAQELMAAYIAEHRLLDRLLIVHQFTDGMIRDKHELRTYPGVNLLIDTDGFGYASQKIANYNRYIRDDQAPHGGMKLFYRRDIDLMSPGAVSELIPQPDLVVFE